MRVSWALRTSQELHRGAWKLGHHICRCLAKTRDAFLQTQDSFWKLLYEIVASKKLDTLARWRWCTRHQRTSQKEKRRTALLCIQLCKIIKFISVVDQWSRSGKVFFVLKERSPVRSNNCIFNALPHSINLTHNRTKCSFIFKHSKENWQELTFIESYQ